MHVCLYYGQGWHGNLPAKGISTKPSTYISLGKATHVHDLELNPLTFEWQADCKGAWNLFEYRKP